jgi:Protein of unknown function (DUF2971)
MTDLEQSNLPPPRLYKYRSLADNGLKHLTDVLQNHRIWWSSPATFNDPFDCFPVIDLSGTEAEVKRWSTIQVQRNFPSLTRQIRRQKIREVTQAMRRYVIGSRTANSGGTDAWSEAALEMGVLCLAENPEDMLMWGHYAQSHKGICLEFDTRNSPFNLAHRISYSEERSVFRPLDLDRSKLMERVLLRKAKAWEYEREWRIFGAGRVGLVEFPADALTSIILGAKISADDEAQIRQVMTKREKPISIRRVEIDSKCYALNLIDA